jgi:hypothetical protein
MLDALKFAFEILIVGALALPWVAILYHAFWDDGSTGFEFDLSFVPEGARSAASVALVLAFGYLIGSAVSRFSRDFFNDELWQPLPTENVIRDSVYHDELCSDHWTVVTVSKPIHLQPPENFCDFLTRMTPEARVAAIDKAVTLTDEQKAKIKAIYEADMKKMMDLRDSGEDRATMRTEANAQIKALLTGVQKPKFDKYLASRKFNFNQEFDQKVQELFQLEESELLLQGVDKIDRLKQYFDQITVLRGAAFNGFVLFSLALFGLFGKLKESWSRHRILQLLAFLPPVLAAIFVVQNILRHDDHLLGLYSDPPLAELVILLLAAVGFFMTWKPASAIPYFRICIIGLVMMVVSFGGWWWTEVMYDLQVIHSLSEVNYKGEQNPLAGQRLIMKQESPSQEGPASPVPASSTPGPNQKP